MIRSSSTRRVGSRSAFLTPTGDAWPLAREARPLKGATMSDENKRNLQFFEAPSMRELYDCMQAWQEANQKRLLSVSIQADGGKFCCIALTNPTEVVITSSDGERHAKISSDGPLYVRVS